MSGQARRYWLTLGAISSLIALLAVINLIIGNIEINISPLAGNVEAGSATAQKLANHPKTQSDMSLPQTLIRPLFSPTRQDFVEPAGAEPVIEPVAGHAELSQSEILAPDISLKGTRNFARKRSALIATAAQDSRWVDIGDDIDGWSVVSIDHEVIQLRREGQEITIQLYPLTEN